MTDAPLTGYVGNTYRLLDCPAEKDGVAVVLHGEFEVVERYTAIEPAAGITREGFALIPAGLPDGLDLDKHVIDVDTWELLERVDPERCERERQRKREAEEGE